MPGTDARTPTEFPDGRLRWPYVLPRDPQGLSISAPGYAELRLEVHPLEGQMLDLGVLQLEPVPVVEVRVLDATSGEPVELATVTLFDPDLGSARSSWTEQRTDADGRIRINGVLDATTVLRVRHDRYVPFESERVVHSGNAPEVVRLTPRADVPR